MCAADRPNQGRRGSAFNFPFGLEGEPTGHELPLCVVSTTLKKEFAPAVPTVSPVPVPSRTPAQASLIMFLFTAVLFPD